MLFLVWLLFSREVGIEGSQRGKALTEKTSHADNFSEKPQRHLPGWGKNIRNKKGSELWDLRVAKRWTSLFGHSGHFAASASTSFFLPTISWFSKFGSVSSQGRWLYLCCREASSEPIRAFCPAAWSDWASIGQVTSAAPELLLGMLSQG